MEKLKKIAELDNGDRVKGKNGEVIQVIGNHQGVLFVYNEFTRLFETLNLSKQKNNFAKLIER